MALLVQRRAVRGRGPCCAGAAPGLPCVRAADGVLVGLWALRASGSDLAGLGAPGQVPRMPGDPCPAAVVCAAAAPGCGGGDRLGAGAGGGRGGPAAGGGGLGGAAYQRAGLAAAVSGQGAHPGRRPGRAGGRARRARGGAARRWRGGRPARALGGLGLGPAAARRPRADQVAAGGRRQRRRVACHHHEPALGGAWWAGLDAARPVKLVQGGAMPPPPPPPAGAPDPSKRAEAVALFRSRVIAEAANPRLTAAERGRIVRALAASAHQHPDGTLRAYSRGTLDRWTVAYQARGLAGLRPVKRADAGTVRRHPELLGEAAALRSERPARSAAHIARKGLDRAALAAEPARAFGRYEAERPNQRWIGDVLVGPFVPHPRVAGSKRARLFLLVDDHSR